MKARKKRIDGEVTRERILAAAEVEFSEKGFALASVREICKRARVNCALANRYFGSKENLYRTVAKRLFGDLGAPMTELAKSVKDEASWRNAVRTWVDDFLFMTLPTERAQKLCAGLFRHEVTCPTKFHQEFMHEFGKPVYDSLYTLITKKERDPVKADLVASAVWSQVSVYALADQRLHMSFRPRGVTTEAWREQVRDFICTVVYGGLK